MSLSTSAAKAIEAERCLSVCTYIQAGTFLDRNHKPGT